MVVKGAVGEPLKAKNKKYANYTILIRPEEVFSCCLFFERFLAEPQIFFL